MTAPSDEEATYVASVLTIYTKQPSVNRKQIRAFAELDFVAKHENLVFVGPADPVTF